MSEKYTREDMVRVACALIAGGFETHKDDSEHYLALRCHRILSAIDESWAGNEEVAATVSAMLADNRPLPTGTPEQIARALAAEAVPMDEKA